MSNSDLCGGTRTRLMMTPCGLGIKEQECTQKHCKDVAATAAGAKALCSRETQLHLLRLSPGQVT